jgi:hypothetical protein
MPTIENTWGQVHKKGSEEGLLKRIVNGPKIREIIEPVKNRIIRCNFELVHSMPKQGVASTFTFGSATGSAITALMMIGIEPRFVNPNTWKARFGLRCKPKVASLDLAKAVFADRNDIMEQLTQKRCVRDKEDCIGFADAIWIASHHVKRNKKEGVS